MKLSDDKRNEIARDISDYWKHNGSDDEFYYNCRDNVDCEVGELIEDNDDWNRECDIIMELIENKYRYDNWEARELFEETDKIIIQYKDLMINDMMFRGNVWSIELYGHKVYVLDKNDKVICDIDYCRIESIRIGDDNDDE